MNIDINALNIGIENSLNYRCLSTDQINELTHLISPFENNQSLKLKFEKIFPANSRLRVGFNTNLNQDWTQTISHNGGYEKLAYLFAALGDVPKVLRCLDSLNKYNETYNQNWNNSTNIAGYFLMYNHDKSFQLFVNAYSKTLGIPGHLFIKTIANMAGMDDVRKTVKLINQGNYNENLALLDNVIIKKLFRIYKSSLEEEVKDRNELNFNLSLFYKHQGVIYDKISTDRATGFNRNYIDSLFSIANEYYSKLPAKFLEAGTEVYLEPSIIIKENRVIKRSHLFLYPDHLKVCASFTSAGGFVYYGDTFLNFMIRHDLIRRYYHDEDDYNLLTAWINRYFELYGTASGTDLWNRAAMNYSPLSHTTLNSVDSIISRSGFADAMDDAWINMKLALDYFESGDTLKAFEHVQRIKLHGFSKPYYAESGPYLNMLLTVTQQLAIRGKRTEARNIVGQFSNIKNRTLAYSKLAAFCKMSGYNEESEIYQDSALADLSQVKAFRFNSGWHGFDYRTGLVEMLTLQEKGSRKAAGRGTGKQYGH